MDPLTLGGIGSILGGLGGLFGSKKPKKVDIADNIRDQAWGARQAADKFGFNPLTMLQYGNPAGAGFVPQGGTPPLASIAAITGGLADINDVTSGDKARRDAAEELQNDLLRVQIDKLRSGVVASPVAATAVQSVSPIPSPLGRRADVQATRTTAAAPAKFSQGENIFAPGRKEDIAPLVNSPGAFEIENAMTPYGSITLPGEGEPWGFDEGLTAVAFGAPQLVWQAGKKAIDEIKASKDDTPEEASERRRKAVKDHVIKHPPGMAGIFSRSMEIWR